MEAVLECYEEVDDEVIGDIWYWEMGSTAVTKLKFPSINGTPAELIKVVRNVALPLSNKDCSQEM